MSVEYDLVIIGSTYEAIYAALKAVYLKARVALVAQPSIKQLDVSEMIFERTFTHVTRLARQLSQWDEKSDDHPQWHQAQIWASEVCNSVAEQNALSLLAVQGVDVIDGFGEFVRLPEFGLVVDGRKLRSTSYLIATGSRPTVPEIPGLDEVSYLTAAEIWNQNTLDSLPQQLMIIGETPTAIQLAQILGRFGRDITLLMADKRLLIYEDSDISNLIQAQLEAEGIKIFTQSSIHQIKSVQEKKYVQTGNYVIEADEIIFITRHEANIKGLNLEGVGVHKGLHGIISVNQKLRTSNPRIYACGSLIGGYSFPNLAQYEAHIALKNALFLPIFEADYHAIPYVIFTDPPIARVGLTEAQARRHYGEDVSVIEHSFKTLIQSQVLGETTGFCKLVVRNNGEILGGHIMGAEAEELIMIIVLAIKQKLPLQSLDKLSYPFSARSEIIHKITSQWQHQKWMSNTFLRNWVESWLIWKRKF